MPKTANARQSDGTDAALVATLISSNETTDGKQPANMVDGLFAIARAIEGLAEKIEGASESIGSRITDVLDDIVNGIEDAMTRNRRPTDTEQEGK